MPRDIRIRIRKQFTLQIKKANIRKYNIIVCHLLAENCNIPEAGAP